MRATRLLSCFLTLGAALAAGACSAPGEMPQGDGAEAMVWEGVKYAMLPSGTLAFSPEAYQAWRAQKALEGPADRFAGVTSVTVTRFLNLLATIEVPADGSKTLGDVLTDPEVQADFAKSGPAAGILLYRSVWMHKDYFAYAVLGRVPHTGIVSEEVMRLPVYPGDFVTLAPFGEGTGQVLRGRGRVFKRVPREIQDAANQAPAPR